MIPLDRTNLHLVELLQRDARVSTSELARLVNRAESTVRERLANLERDGVIRGYRALVDPERLGFPIHALVRAESGLGRVQELRDHLAALPQVVSAAMTTGSKPLRIELRSESPARLEQFLEKRLAPLGLERLETGLVVHQLVPTRPLPLTLASGGVPVAVANGPWRDNAQTETVPLEEKLRRLEPARP